MTSPCKSNFAHLSKGLPCGQLIHSNCKATYRNERNMHDCVKFKKKSCNSDLIIWIIQTPT